MPPVAAGKVSPMLKKFNKDSEFLLCMQPMVAFKWVAVAEIKNKDGSRTALVLKRSLALILGAEHRFQFIKPICVEALNAKTQEL